MYKVLERLTGYGDIIEVAGLKSSKDTLSFVKNLNERFDITCKSNRVEGAYKSTIFFCNHHTGALDFLASYEVIAKVAPDLKVVINKTLSHLKPLEHSAITVHSVSTGKRNIIERELIKEHLLAGGNILIFPAGKVAGKVNGIVQDAPWRLGIFDLLKCYGENAVPIYINLENPKYFYFIRKFFPRISPLLLARCLKDLRGKEVDVVMGKPVAREEFEFLNVGQLSDLIRKKLYSLGERHEY